MKDQNPINPFVQIGFAAVGIAFIMWVYIGINNSNSADQFQKNLSEYNTKELSEEIRAENHRNRPRY